MGNSGDATFTNPAKPPPNKDAPNAIIAEQPRILPIFISTHNIIYDLRLKKFYDLLFFQKI
jgi:hypothetical protein